MVQNLLEQGEFFSSLLEFYTRELQTDAIDRRGLFYALLDSPEGRVGRPVKYPYTLLLEDFVEVHPNESFLPYVSADPIHEPQLCECANPRRWLDESWRAHLDELALCADPELMHRKGFEAAQTIEGLERLGLIRPDVRCLGVGSGHEAILYWLANHVGEVVGTDLYEGDWTSEGAAEGDPEVLENPAKYAPFEYRADRLRFLRMDGRELEFPDNSFDVVFSMSSIEHFGGPAEAARAMREKARVCRPGGVAVVATELILNGGQHEEFFTLDELRESIVAGSGMNLIQPPVFRVPRYALENPCVIPSEQHRTPHLVLDFDGTLITSIILFLRHE